MTRSFRYRLCPTRVQEARLREWLEETREIYNAALQERRDAWQKQRVSVSRIDQEKQLPAIREARPEFDGVPIVVLRGTLRRLDKAFASFFRRCRSGETPGFPRFKGRDRWSAILIDDLGTSTKIVAGGKRVAIPLLGKIKLKMHRPIEGRPKALRLTVDAAGRWFVTFACVDVPKRKRAPTDSSVGIDLGLHSLVATSDGGLYENPRHLADARLRLERAQRRVSRRARGSKRRRKAARILARHHDRVANLRRETHISIARELVEKYDLICLEDLNVRALAKSRLAKSVNDAAWGNLRHWIACKAEEAGREILEIDPRGTSQTCSACGCVVEKALSVRVHSCPCGLILDRDVNAARNVLRLGLSLRGAATPVGVRQRSAKHMKVDRVTA